MGHVDEPGLALGIWGRGGYIFLANGSGGLRAYTFNGVAFTDTGHIDDGGSARKAWGDGTYIYLANGSDGLRAYTYNGVAFTNVGHIDDGAFGYFSFGVWGDGVYVYLANGDDGLRAYTFDGANFVNVGHTDDADGALDIWYDGVYLYVCCGLTGFLRVYSFNGTSFTRVAIGSAGVSPNAVGVHGDGVYISNIFLGNHTDGLRAYKWV